MTHQTSERELEFVEAVKAVVAIYEANHGVVSFEQLCRDNGLNLIQANDVYRKIKEEEK